MQERSGTCKHNGQRGTASAPYRGMLSLPSWDTAADALTVTTMSDSNITRSGSSNYHEEHRQIGRRNRLNQGG